MSLLENLRFYPGEKKNDLHFSKQLASLADIYVNEAFSASHRGHASVAAITKLLPSFAGLNFENEVKKLSQLMHEPKRPFVMIIGGKKIADKVGAIENLTKIADTVLVGGAAANNFLKAEGFDIANSYLGENFVNFANKLLDENKQEASLLNDYLPIPKIIYPLDVIAATSPEATQVKTLNLLDPKNKDIADELMFLDIGPKTIELFSQIIKQAKTIFWNGPMGVFENPRFAQGTKKIAQAVASSKAYSVLGGGDTLSAINQFNLSDKYDYMSAAGGAALEFLSGKSLPGLKPLEK